MVGSGSLGRFDLRLGVDTRSAYEARRDATRRCELVGRHPARWIVDQPGARHERDNATDVVLGHALR